VKSLCGKGSEGKDQPKKPRLATTFCGRVNFFLEFFWWDLN
jgi:hypothetical protein